MSDTTTFSVQIDKRLADKLEALVPIFGTKRAIIEAAIYSFVFKTDKAKWDTVRSCREFLGSESDAEEA